MEAALISALAPAFNRITPPVFRPIGVPGALMHRQCEDPLSMEKVRRITGGAIFVRVKRGNHHITPHLDLTAPTDTAITAHSRAWWHLGEAPSRWEADPASSPRALIAVAGPPSSARYILAAYLIDAYGWRTARRSGSLWEVPLQAGTSLDTFALRGRRLPDVRFSRRRQDLVRIID